VTHFEEVTCKLLGVVLFLLIIVIGLQVIGCSCPVPPPPSDYIDKVEMKNLA